MKLTEIRDALSQRGIQLTKSLGQNFLHDGNQLRRIADAAQITRTDRILEIGPGLGPLTELLVARAGEVLAIEKDRRLCEVMREKFAGATNLSLLHDDALDYLRREPHDWSGWKLVANLPYSVASPMLVELAQAPGCPQRIVATLQLEVARRLVARADDDDYGVLSLLMQLRYEPLDHFKIPADCFFPAPEVDSMCVVLERRTTPLLPPEQHAGFERLVKLGFSQRRKMMLKLLKTKWPEEKLIRAFAQLGLSPQIRAEKVTLEQFAEMVKELDRAAGAAI
jgi:16S rRNA (adenine1518-N6/adenine1519-N6)-dimethyltransferase